MIADIKKDADARMKKCIRILLLELAKIRTGRAHPNLVSNIQIACYGTTTPLNQVASVIVADARTLTVTPFDKSLVQNIEKAIIKSDLGLNPTTVGQIIHIPLPPLTEDRRKSLIKQMRTEVENAKVTLRNIRREANKNFKHSLKEKKINQDAERQGQDDIQKLTDRFVNKLDQIAHDKETEIMQI